MSRILNEFIKGACWGFVAFVHFALVTVLTYRFALNCLPRQLVEQMLCLPGKGPAQCPEMCLASDDAFFYTLAIVTVVAAAILPLLFGLIWAAKARHRVLQNGSSALTPVKILASPASGVVELR